MNLRLITLPRLPAALFAGALLLGGSAFYLALETRSDSQSELLSARQRALAADRDLRHTPERLAQDRAQSATYSQLRASGFIATEDRLDWLSQLARVQGEMQLDRLSWRLASQQPSDLGYGLRQSNMEIELGPVDSARLDQFFARLRQQAHGRYTVSGCTVVPESGAGVASCTLQWWTWNAR